MNIQDIATLTGFSIATVSRAINQTGYVKEETQRKIFEVIDAHQYVPNAVARSLSMNDTNCIGIVIPDIENDFFSKVINGVVDVAEKERLNIMFFATNESIKREHAYLELVEAQRLIGLIIIPVSEKDNITRERLLRFKEKGLPIVLVDRDIPNSGMDGIFSDNVRGACEGVERFIELGHTKIATVTGPLTSKPGKERLEGYLLAMKNAGIEVPEAYIMYGDFRMGRAYDCMNTILECGDPPTAVFASNNLTTLGCIKSINEKGYKLGQDISLLGFDEIESLRIANIGISVIDRNVNQIGREAMRILLKRLKGDKTPEAMRKVLPCNVILREGRRPGGSQRTEK